MNFLNWYRSKLELKLESGTDFEVNVAVLIIYLDVLKKKYENWLCNALTNEILSTASFYYAQYEF